MKKIITAFLLFCTCILGAQSPRGITLTTPAKPEKTGKTYALIVGISKYKNPAIPQLQFADRDAVAFRDYLMASGLDSNNIITLINEKATNGEFWASLNFITDLAKQGDKVYIYFSGHGDVENKTVVKDAYLLPYDAPKCVYPAGAIGVMYLKSWIATFSANGVQAVFIADACRSGNLAGGREGMEATAAMLKDKWQDEIKILSCQPGELSLEGKQWGEGRGLFSYELINGMAGMADKNKDGKVTLRELNLYLMDKVPDEANPLPQNPMLFGNMEVEVSKVNPSLLKTITLNHSSPVLALVDVKGFDESLLARLDDTIRRNYSLFKTCVDSNLLCGNNDNAYKYFTLIPDNDSTRVLKAIMKGKLAACLMNDLQLKINGLLKNDMAAISGSDDKWKAVTLRSLLGDAKLMKLGFLSKILFFEGYSKVMNYGANRELDSALAIEPNAAYIYFVLATHYLANKDPDSALICANYSIHISPLFAAPRLIKGSAYTIKGDFNNCERESDSILLIDSSLIWEAKLIKAFSYIARCKGDSVHGKIYEDSLTKIYWELDALWPQAAPQKKSLMIRNLFQFDFILKDSVRAIKHFDAIVRLKQMKPARLEFYLACLECVLEHNSESITHLRKYIESDGNFDTIMNSMDSGWLHRMYPLPEFKTLMKKYFPDQYKE